MKLAGLLSESFISVPGLQCLMAFITVAVGCILAMIRPLLSSLRLASLSAIPELARRSGSNALLGLSVVELWVARSVAEAGLKTQVLQGADACVLRQ